MKRLYLALALLLGLIGSAAAQGVERICLYTIQGNGNISCQDISLNFPLPTRSGAYGVGQSSSPPQYCQITSFTAATKLVTASCSTGSVLANATIAQICLTSSGTTVNQRYLSAPGVGTNPAAPTAGVGMPMNGALCYQFAGPLSTVQFIGNSGDKMDVETFQ